MAVRRRGTRFVTLGALSFLISGVVIAGLATTGHAQPGQVPDSGSRPTASGQIALPDGAPARPPSSREVIDGPLAPEIAELEIEIESVTQQLQSILPEVGPAVTAAEYAEQQWQLSATELATAQQALDELVGESFRGAAALPPELYLPQLPSLTAHAPLPVAAPLGARTAARALVEAREGEQAAAELVASTSDAEQTLSELREELETELAGLRGQLEQRRERNAELIAEQARAQEAVAQADAADRFPQLQPVNGFRAHADAVGAVRFAMAQLGKPYLWGAEGPDRYDCSGLVWAGYRTVGEQLPRVAADQYQGTADRLITRSATVAQRGLLPGDLVFFSSGPTWQSIHHVGIYVGDGQMVHAPNRNEVVKVSPVWWSRFFAATRVIDAVPVSGGPPSTTPPPPGGQSTPPPTSPGSPTPSPEPTTVEVPSLAGMTAAQAEDQLAGSFLGDQRTTDDCGEAERGTVVDQSPDPGTPALVSSTVTYHICDPPDPDPVLMPDGLVGRSYEDARSIIEQLSDDHDLDLLIDRQPVPDTAPLDQVLDTTPDPDVELNAGETVTLTVSLGFPEVPQLIDEPCEEVATILADLDLDFEVRFLDGPEATDDAEAGTVAGQDPVAGEPLEPGGPLELVIFGPHDCGANSDGGDGSGDGGEDASGQGGEISNALNSSLRTHRTLLIADTGRYFV